MDELHYVYALTPADSPRADLGPGVDPRHGVELLLCGGIAAAASLVGLDQFDLTKIQEGSADLAWLSRVALRHNQIVQQLAQRGPVLPLRLATLFCGKSSLVEKLAQCETEVAAFLDTLGDRQEWAVKIYLDHQRAERALLGETCAVPQPPHQAGSAGAGVTYLAGRREKLNRSAQLHAVVRSRLVAVEAGLQCLSSEWRRLRPLSPELTARPESMVWNGAVLVSKTQERPLRAACDRWRDNLAPQGLLLELTGPWPAYHFCPTIGTRDEGLGARD